MQVQPAYKNEVTTLNEDLQGNGISPETTFRAVRDALSQLVGCAPGVIVLTQDKQPVANLDTAVGADWNKPGKFGYSLQSVSDEKAPLADHVAPRTHAANGDLCCSVCAAVFQLTGFTQHNCGCLVCPKCQAAVSGCFGKKATSDSVQCPRHGGHTRHPVDAASGKKSVPRPSNGDCALLRKQVENAKCTTDTCSKTAVVCDKGDYPRCRECFDKYIKDIAANHGKRRGNGQERAVGVLGHALIHVSCNCGEATKFCLTHRVAVCGVCSDEHEDCASVKLLTNDVAQKLIRATASRRKHTMYTVLRNADATQQTALAQLELVDANLAQMLKDIAANCKTRKGEVLAQEEQKVAMLQKMIDDIKKFYTEIRNDLDRSAAKLTDDVTKAHAKDAKAAIERLKKMDAIFGEAVRSRHVLVHQLEANAPAALCVGNLIEDFGGALPKTTFAVDALTLRTHKANARPVEDYALFKPKGAVTADGHTPEFQLDLKKYDNLLSTTETAQPELPAVALEWAALGSGVLAPTERSIALHHVMLDRSAVDQATLNQLVAQPNTAFEKVFNMPEAVALRAADGAGATLAFVQRAAMWLRGCKLSDAEAQQAVAAMGAAADTHAEWQAAFDKLIPVQ